MNNINTAFPVKLHLKSYITCSHCKYAIDRLKNEPIDYLDWKIQWAGICALLKTSMHLMRNSDAKSELPEPLKKNLIQAWHKLEKNKAKYPIYWQFIDKERNNILKEYEYCPDVVIITQDGAIKNKIPSLLSTMEDGEKETLLIRSGKYKGRLALEVLTEAAQWTEEYIFDAIRTAGYDPEELRSTIKLLPPSPINKPKTLTLLKDT